MPKKRRGDAEENEMDIEGADMKKKKMPTGEDIQPKLVTMIKKLDEELNGASVESAIESLTNVLEENLEPAAYLPEKITIFSTLVGLLNARSSDFGERLLLKFVDELHYTFMNGEYDISVRLATFLCDLCNARVVTPHSVILFLDNFIDLATDENIKSNFFVYLVLHTLPWVGLELNDKLPTKLNDLMGRISLYLNRRQKSHINILKVWAAEEYPQQEDYLDSLWSQLQKLREQNWEEKHILRTYAFLNPLNRDVLENSKNHPLPRVVFRLFDKNDCVESEIVLPASNCIERFLVEEDLNWIIDNNYLDWKLCAQALLNYHRKETVPLNYVMIETVFNQLFRLPAAPHHELFYGALLIELCRSEANTMPQVLALAAELLYRVTDTMQPICLDRFVNWFSYHLSNFEYRWSWSDWIECVKLDSLHPRRIFVREVIDKCLRLSYHKKVVGFLPPELAPIIPDEPSIVYILDDAQHPAFSKAEQFRALISNKVENEEILAALRMSTDDIDEGAEQRSEFSGEYSVDAVAIFFAVLLKLSSRTFTHTFSAFTSTIAITPFVPTREEGPKQQLIRFPRPKDVISNLADPRHLISSSQTILKRSGEAERLNNYLLSGLIIVQSMAQNDAMSFSGSVAAAGIGISDLYSHMRSRNQSRTNDNVYKSPPWMPSTMHLTSCRLSPYLNHDQHPVTGLLLANHTQISVMLKSMANDFEKMWKRKANVHQYESAFDKGGNNPDAGKDECEKKMSASKESLDKLLALYREACSDKFELILL
uniref:Nuclear cap-binding protein subunit 1 n=1 Tax=Globodera pallida TaxID=36090 RepID=A0A183BVH2_GLOPA